MELSELLVAVELMVLLVAMGLAELVALLDLQGVEGLECLALNLPFLTCILIHTML